MIEAASIAHWEQQWMGSPRDGEWKEDILNEAGVGSPRGSFTKQGLSVQTRLALLC